jgi:hypothetical protein
MSKHDPDMDVVLGFSFVIVAAFVLFYVGSWLLWLYTKALPWPNFGGAC